MLISESVSPYSIRPSSYSYICK